jgi:hypothetical protein
MKLKHYLNEEKPLKSKMVKGVYGNQRTIEGYKDYDRLYIFKKKIKGQGSAYMVSKDDRVSMDSMVDIGGEYWFSTLKDLHKALNK